VLYIILCLFKI